MPRFNYSTSFSSKDFIHCILCGFWIGSSHNVPWLRHFRALYLNSDELKLSGVGFKKYKNDTRLEVPIDTHTRWDDIQDDHVLEIDLDCRSWEMFLFHEVCWEHLTMHFESELEICRELTKLSAILKRLPIPMDQMDIWGSYLEPFQQPPLNHLMQHQKDFPRPCLEVENRFCSANNPTDWFQRFPLEIREFIAVSLPTSDFLRLRLVSRSIGSFFSSPRYWKSHFKIDGERGFLSYLTQQSEGEKSDQAIDWRLLYHCTNVIRTRRKFQVTVNVWEVCRWLRDAFLTYGLSLEKPLPEFGGRSLQHYHNTRMRGTRIERVTLPPSLVTIGISVFMEGKAADITGMEFFGEDGTSVSIGNKVPDAEIITEREAGLRLPYKTLQRCELDDDTYAFDPSHYFPGVQYLIDASSLRGFDFEGNSSGIHIITVLRENGHSRAFGFMNTYEGTGRKYVCVIGMYNIKEVVGTFNSRGLVDLGIRDTTKSRRPSSSSMPPRIVNNFYTGSSLYGAGPQKNTSMAMRKRRNRQTEKENEKGDTKAAGKKAERDPEKMTPAERVNELQRLREALRKEEEEMARKKAKIAKLERLCQEDSAPADMAMD